MIVMKNLVVLHVAQKNFIAAESSERIERALTHQVRSYSDKVYQNGDVIFYQRKGYISLLSQVRELKKLHSGKKSISLFFVSSIQEDLTVNTQ